MIDENKGDAASASASSNWRASIPANAREFLSQYDHLGGEGIDNRTFFHAVQMAKVAYESKIRREDTFNKGRPTRTKRSSLELMRSMSLSPTQPQPGSPDHRHGGLVGRVRRPRSGEGSERGADEGPSRVLVRMVQALVDSARVARRVPAIGRVRVQEFLEDLEEGYNHPNDYHTATHAADVVQACGYFPLERLEDATHRRPGDGVCAHRHRARRRAPGGSITPHLVNTEAPEAVRWNDVSVNENGHYHILRALLTKAGFA